MRYINLRHTYLLTINRYIYETIADRHIVTIAYELSTGTNFDDLE